MTINIATLKLVVEKDLMTRSVCHDNRHALNVESIALKIAQSYPHTDLDVLRAIALLHDVWDHKFVDDPKAIKDRYSELLTELGFKLYQVLNIISSIEALSWSKGQIPQSIEGKIVQDADRITAIGATGILRAATYSAQHRSTFDVTIQHLVDKCLLLKNSLNLSESRLIAVSRHKLLVDFIDAYRDEVA